MNSFQLNEKYTLVTNQTPDFQNIFLNDTDDDSIMNVDDILHELKQRVSQIEPKLNDAFVNVKVNDYDTLIFVSITTLLHNIIAAKIANTNRSYRILKEQIRLITRTTLETSSLGIGGDYTRYKGIHEQNELSYFPYHHFKFSNNTPLLTRYYYRINKDDSRTKVDQYQNYVQFDVRFSEYGLDTYLGHKSKDIAGICYFRILEKTMSFKPLEKPGHEERMNYWENGEGYHITIYNYVVNRHGPTTDYVVGINETRKGTDDDGICTLSVPILISQDGVDTWCVAKVYDKFIQICPTYDESVLFYCKSIKIYETIIPLNYYVDGAYMTSAEWDTMITGVALGVL